MDEKKYSAVVTAVKTGTPLLIIIISQALHAAAVAAGVQIDIGTIYGIVTGGYAAIIGFKNWLKNHKNKGTAAAAAAFNKKQNFD